MTKRRKDELIEVVLDLARNNPATLRDLLARFEVQLSADGLVQATQRAIADATDFDRRQINHNFDYDYQAYESIQRNLKQLVAAGRIVDAMQLCLELMDQGSHQVEMSDEGLMADEIADCLKVVITALKKSDLPPIEIVKWCAAMTKSDRVGFICDEELKVLQKKFKYK